MLHVMTPLPFTSLSSLHEKWSRAMMTHRGGILKTISHQLYLIVWMAQQWSREMMTHGGGIDFLKTIPLSHLFLCSSAARQNYFLQFTFILLSHDLPRSEHEISSHIRDAPSEWHHLYITQPRVAHMSSHLFTWHLLPFDLRRAQPDMHDHQGLYKGVICTCNVWFCWCSSFIRVSLTSHYWSCSAGSSHIEQHWSMQLSRPEQQNVGWDADQWSSISSADRITLNLQPGEQPSTKSCDGGAHRLSLAHQSPQVQHSTRYHHLFLMPQLRIDVTWCSILTS